MARVMALRAHSYRSAFPFLTNWKFTLCVVFVAQVLSAVGFSMIFPFLPLYIDELGSVGGHSTELLSGLVISVQGLTMMFTAPLWGAVADRFGRKKMIMRAMFGGGVTLAMMAFVQSAEQLILVRALQGLVTGTVSANNALVASVTPRSRVGFAMGTLQVGLWAGVAVGPLLGGVLADLFGYSMPFLLTAGLLSVGGFVVMLGVSEDFRPAPGLERFAMGAMIRGWRDILATSGVSLLLMMRFLAGLARTVIIPIAPLFVVTLVANDAASSNTWAGAVMAVSAATSTIGAVYLGNLGDRISHRRVLLWSAVAATCLYLPQAFVGDIWQLLALQGMAGFAAGGIVSAPSALLSRFTSKETAGAVYGLDNSVISGSRAAAPLVGASVAILLGMRGTFFAAALVFALIALVTWRLLPCDGGGQSR